MQAIISNLIWTDFHRMKMLGLPLGRRVTVARGASGQIVVFSPLQVSDRTISELKALGNPTAFVIPSRLHDRYFPGYFSHFPQSVFLGSQASLADHPKWKLTEFSPSSPELDGFDMVKVEGMPKVQEHVFYHRATRTLILADLLFNIRTSDGWFTHGLLKIADMDGNPGPSRLWRAMIKNEDEFAHSLRLISKLDFDRIIPGHGEWIDQNAKHIFNEAFSRWLSEGSHDS